MDVLTKYVQTGKLPKGYSKKTKKASLAAVRHTMYFTETAASATTSTDPTLSSATAAVTTVAPVEEQDGK